MAGESQPGASKPTPQAGVLTSALEAVWHRLAPHREAATDAMLTKWLEGHEDDAVAIARGVLAGVASHPDMPAESRPIFDLLLRPEHQTQAVLTVLGVYPIVSAFVMAAVGPFVQDVSNLAWSEHPSQPLSPAEAALAVLRGTWSADEAAHEASLTGLDRRRFDVLYLNEGEPPGIGQLLEAYRRGYIDQTRLVRGIRQSRIRDEWIDVVEKLRYAPVGPGEVLAGLVQGHLTPDDAGKRLSDAGINPDNLGWLYETHGRPPGVVELGSLVNRGEMTEAEWEQAVRESDIKNKYIPFLAKLHRHLMPERTVVSAVRQGVLTVEQGKEHLRALGFNEADAATLVAEASSTKTAHVKELSESQTMSAYAERLISKAQAEVRLSALGYTSDEIALVVQLADHAHHARFQEQGISRVHTLYVSHKIDASAAATDLDKIGIDAAARDDLVRLWTAERNANVPTLTLAQCQGLAYRGVFTFAEYVAHVTRLGWSKADARLTYFLAFPPTKQPTNVPEV